MTLVPSVSRCKIGEVGMGGVGSGAGHYFHRHRHRVKGEGGWDGGLMSEKPGQRITFEM